MRWLTARLHAFAVGDRGPGWLTATLDLRWLLRLLRKSPASALRIMCKSTFSNRCAWTAPVIFYTPIVAERLSKLYHDDGVTPYPYWHIALRPSAAVSASARDMANYLRFYLQRGS